jgi:hypothetical protein
VPVVGRARYEGKRFTQDYFCNGQLHIVNADIARTFFSGKLGLGCNALCA